MSQETLPTDTNFLFWPHELQSAGYRNIEKIFHTRCPIVQRVVSASRAA